MNVNIVDIRNKTDLKTRNNVGRQLNLMISDFLIEAGILLRGNGVLHTILVTHMMLAHSLSRCCCILAY
jgi:hypothetical protein